MIPPVPTWLKKLVLLVTATVVTVGVLEVGFRVAGYDAVYDVYSKPEAFWQHDPLLGWSLEPGAEGEYVGPRPFPIAFRSQIAINEQGFRDDEIVPLPPSGHRILLLGDSQAVGFEVALEETYAALLERDLAERLGAPVQVVNAAVRGYGTDQAYLLYRERAAALNPDVVVLHATANDPEDNTTLHRMRRPFGKPAFALTPDGDMELVGQPVPDYPLCSAYRLDSTFHVQRIDDMRARAFCWVQTRLADHSALFSFVAARVQQNPQLLRAVYGLGTPQRQDEPVEAAPSAAASPPAAEPAPAAPPAGSVPPVDYPQRLTSVLIAELAAAARADEAQFLLVGEADLELLDVASFAREAIPLVRLEPALTPGEGDVRFANDGHLTELGHRRVAELLAPHLAEMISP